MAHFVIKRIYEPVADDDGYRVLVDRLWPRGISKEKAGLDAWFKEIAPSTKLRIWFGHRPERFAEFEASYSDELHQNPVTQKLQTLAKNHPRITLLYAAKDPEINHAKVLQAFLERLND